MRYQVEAEIKTVGSFVALTHEEAVKQFESLLNKEIPYQYRILSIWSKEQEEI